MAQAGFTIASFAVQVLGRQFRGVHLAKAGTAEGRMRLGQNPMNNLPPMTLVNQHHNYPLNSVFP
jgi:hypothetical protein